MAYQSITIGDIKERVVDYLKTELSRRDLSIKYLSKSIDRDYPNLSRLFKSPQTHRIETIQEALEGLDLSICGFILKS